MATKKKVAKKSPQLEEVPKQLSPLMELREQSINLSDVGSIGWGEGTMQDVLEEIVKTMTPLRHLKEASLQDSDWLNQSVVLGYLPLFLCQMDHILGHAELVLKIEQGKTQAA